MFRNISTRESQGKQRDIRHDEDFTAPYRRVRAGYLRAGRTSSRG
jgi:hypothetical protein